MFQPGSSAFGVKAASHPHVLLGKDWVLISSFQYPPPGTNQGVESHTLCPSVLTLTHAARSGACRGPHHSATSFHPGMRPETLGAISTQCWSLVDWIFTELRLGIRSKGLVLMTNRDGPVGLLLYSL